MCYQKRTLSRAINTFAAGAVCRDVNETDVGISGDFDASSRLYCGVQSQDAVFPAWPRRGIKRLISASGCFKYVVTLTRRGMSLVGYLQLSGTAKIRILICCRSAALHLAIIQKADHDDAASDVAKCRGSKPESVICECNSSRKKR